jgi:LCP family protein required for cell wall assembly
LSADDDQIRLMVEEPSTIPAEPPTVVSEVVSDSKPPAKKRRGPRKEVVISGAVMFIGVCLLGATLAYALVSTKAEVPMGPTLAAISEYATPIPIIVTNTPPPLPTVGPGTPTLLPTPTASPTATLTPTPTDVPGEPVCGGPRRMLILGIGMDVGNDNNEGGRYADVVRVVNINFVHPHVSMLAISRDLWVNVPGMGGDYNTQLETYYGQLLDANGQVIDPPGVYGRLSGTYRFADLLGLGGASVLSQVLYTNFGVPVNNYIAGDMYAFAQVVDAVGGIDVGVVTGAPGVGGGVQHMDGTQALEYARHRESDNDWHRMNRQTEVLLALRQKMLSSEMIPQLPAVIDTVLSYTYTDLTRSQIAALTCLATRLDMDRDYSTYSVSEDMAVGYWTTGGSYVMVPDYGRIRGLVSAWLGN